MNGMRDYDKENYIVFDSIYNDFVEPHEKLSLLQQVPHFQKDRHLGTKLHILNGNRLSVLKRDHKMDLKVYFSLNHDY